MDELADYRRAVVIDHEPFGAVSRAFDFHPSLAGNEERKLSRPAQIGRKLGRMLAYWRLLERVIARRDILHRADECGEYLLALADRRHGASALTLFDDPHVRRSQSARRLAGRELRPAVGPTASQR